MKTKNLIVVVMMVLLAGTARAQSTADIFDPNTPVTWLGLDMTGAIFIGDREKFGSQSDIHQLMKAWNDLMEKEAAKYNVKEMLHKKVEIPMKIDVTRSHNAELDISNILSEKSADHIHLRKDGIEQIAAAYNYEGATGLGLMFNVESFNKINGEGSLWVTFVNMANGDVVFTERMTGPPGGAGMRNYWAKVVFEVMEKVKKKEFNNWKKKLS